MKFCQTLFLPKGCGFIAFHAPAEDIRKVSFGLSHNYFIVLLFGHIPFGLKDFVIVSLKEYKTVDTLRINRALFILLNLGLALAHQRYYYNQLNLILTKVKHPI